jgi:hypothetical protein
LVSEPQETTTQLAAHVTGQSSSQSKINTALSSCGKIALIRRRSPSRVPYPRLVICY